MTQRASRAGSVAARPSRMVTSSALRLAAFSNVTRATPAAGSSVVTLLKDHERVALVDRLALRDQDLLDGALVLGLHGHLHLHRFEDRDGVALGHLVSHGHLDLPYGGGDMRVDVRHEPHDIDTRSRIARSIVSTASMLRHAHGRHDWNRRTSRSLLPRRTANRRRKRWAGFLDGPAHCDRALG